MPNLHLADGTIEVDEQLADEVAPYLMVRTHVHPGVRPVTVEEFEDLVERISGFAKHYGPGPHLSGSPQSVHAGEQGLAVHALKADARIDPYNNHLYINDEHAGVHVAKRGILELHDLPQMMYHISARGPDIREDGVIRAGYAGGLGGASHDRLQVSLTIDPEVARSLKRDIEMMGRMYDRFWETKPEGPYDSPERQEWSLSIYRGFQEEALAQGWEFEFGRQHDGTVDEPIMPGYGIDDWSRQFFSIRRRQHPDNLGSTWDNQSRLWSDPLFFGLDKWGPTIDPSNVEIIAIPKWSLDPKVLVTDFDLDSPIGLQEVRYWGDIELPGGGVTKHMGPGPHPSGSSQDVHGSGGKEQLSVGGFTVGDRVWRQHDMAGGHVISVTPSGNLEVRVRRLGRKPEVDILGPESLIRRPDKVRDEIHEAYGKINRLFKAAEAARNAEANDVNDELDPLAWEYLGLLGGEWEPLVKNHEGIEWLRDNGFEDVADQLEYEWDWEWWDRAAARRAMKVVEPGAGSGSFRHRLEAAVQILDKWFENAQPYIRVEPYILQEIMQRGQVHNQIETGASNGYYNPETRLRLENVLHGHWDEVMAAETVEIGGKPVEGGLGEYPIYGYWSQGPGFDSDLEHYGGIAIELKEGVSATFTLGDSLDHTGAKGIATSGRNYGSAGDAFLGVGTPGQASLGSLGSEVNAVLRANDMSEQIQPYIEAQVHEPVTWDTIRAIHTDIDYIYDMGYDDAEDLYNQLPGGVGLYVGGFEWEPNE